MTISFLNNVLHHGLSKLRIEECYMLHVMKFIHTVL